MRIRWRGLELPTRVVSDQMVSTPTYGRFTIKPFERGFGITVGNSLRRILLSSLEGAAVTSIKIAGADHEFMSLPGVMEDVTDIILNVKTLTVKSHSDTPVTIRVHSEMAGPVTAGMIEADPSIEILNPDMVLATLTEDVPFDMEMTVEVGRGYMTDNEMIDEEADQEIGGIPSGYGADTTLSGSDSFPSLTEACAQTGDDSKTGYDSASVIHRD